MEPTLLASSGPAPLPAAFYPPFRRAAVIGAGTMGAQIAAHLANAGLTVDLLDVTPASLGQSGPPGALVERSWAAAQKLSPDPLFDDAARARVRTGNLDEHFSRLGEADWVIEAVVERLDVKRALLERLEPVVRPDAVVSTNTSGLPIHEVIEGRSAPFQQRFLGTHFFNPPRYLRLLELVPTPHTDPHVVARVAHFGRVHLGKGVVVAHDVPYFIGNRVGVYAMLGAMEWLSAHGYTVEEIDALTGPLVGRPRSATFRTADVVGLDVLADVTRNLYDKVPADERRDRFRVPPVLAGLLEAGAKGAKSRAGFYRKDGAVLRSVNPDTGRYEDPRPLDLGDLDRIKKAGALPARLDALWNEDGRAGAFFRATTLDALAYAARRVPEISDRPADVDRAVRWGFGWEKGPFELWDALGFARILGALDAAGQEVPAWVRAMDEAGDRAFYREGTAYVPGQGYVPDEAPEDERGLAAVRIDPARTLWQSDEAALLDLGEGVACYEFRSKANTLGFGVISGLVQAIARVEQDPNLRGLVVGNDGDNFSVGANLGEVAMMAAQGQWAQLEAGVAGFQDAVQRVRYATKPVVVAVQGRVLGGGCELVMGSPHPVAAAESYIGLVELGVGLIPAGTGTTRLAALASHLAPSGHPSEVQAALARYFETVASARVATSARQAQQFGFLAPHARVVMNAARRLAVAREEVIRLSNEGYLPPPVETAIQVLGRPGRAALTIAVRQFQDGRFISDYDAYLALAFARALTGGEFSGPQVVHEDYLIELEREVFMGLLGQKQTQERITGLLMTGKPVRN